MNTTLSTPQQKKPGKSDISLKYHFFAIIILSGIMFFLLDSATDEEVLDITRLLDNQSQDYDYFMAEVDTVHYTPSGFADYRLQAQRVTHYPNPEYSIIETPRFLLFSEDNANWEINSTSGRVEKDLELNQERLTLSENVIISGLSANGKTVNIYTDTLTLYPEEKRISSESDVRFESEGITSSSKGITADLNTNVFRQLADGKIQYDK